MHPWNFSNASTMSSVSLRKSRMKVFSFSGWMRLSRERVWTAASPTSDLVHVHRVQQWLVESGLELLRHDEHAVIRRAELLGCAGFRGTRSCWSRSGAFPSHHRSCPRTRQAY